MAVKTYTLTNCPQVLVADYNGCLTTTGGNAVKAMVLMADEVLLADDQDPDNPTRMQRTICAHISTLVLNEGASVTVNGSDIEITLEETLATDFVAEGYFVEVT